MTSGNVTPSNSNNNNNNNSSCYSFEVFMQGWCQRLEQLSDEITAVVEGKVLRGGSEGGLEEGEVRKLIARALGHFEEYFEHNSRAAHQDVFALFAPPWSSSLERAFLWIAGFRPGALLELVSNSIRDLNPVQSLALDRLKRETKLNEKVVADELARIQETAAAPPLLDAIREVAWPTAGESLEVTREPIEQLRIALENVVASADSLRVATGAKVAEILSPPQCLRFLVAAIKLLQRMRSSGMQRENFTGWEKLAAYINQG